MFQSYRFYHSGYQSMIDIVDDDFNETVKGNNLYTAVISIYSKRNLNVGSALARAVKLHVARQTVDLSDELPLLLKEEFITHGLLPKYQTELDTYLMLL